MAKTTNVPKGVKIPANYTRATTEIAGFWSEKIAPSIHFIPLSVTLSDNKQDANKVKIIVLGTLVDPCELAIAGGQTVEGKVGETVAIEYRPGMSAIKDLCGVKCVMYQEGTTPIKGRMLPMKNYEILRSGVGRPLKVSSDFRKNTKGLKTPFTEAPAPVVETSADNGFFDDADE